MSENCNTGGKEEKNVSILWAGRGQTVCVLAEHFNVGVLSTSMITSIVAMFPI